MEVLKIKILEIHLYWKYTNFLSGASPVNGVLRSLILSVD